MARLQELFGDAKKTVDTLLSMKCLIAEEFDGCEGCKFFEMGETFKDPCPQYPGGAGNYKGSFESWLDEDL